MTKIGSLAPAHSTGLGKALLARLSDEAFEATLPQLALKPYTPKTIVNVERLRKELAAVRSRGYAIDDEETALGLKCVAVAVDLPAVGPAAISLSGPAADFTEGTIPAFAEELHRTAAWLHDIFAGTADYIPASDPAVYAQSAQTIDAAQARRRKAAGWI